LERSGIGGGAADQPIGEIETNGIETAVPGRGAGVVSLALEKHLFLNVPRKRPVVSPCSKKSCDINKRLDPF
jgi:hypothetical protein